MFQSPSLKKQGKLNTRPGKVGVWGKGPGVAGGGAWGYNLRACAVPSQVIFFSEPGCQGSSREVYEDIADASGWDLVASIRVVRGW